MMTEELTIPVTIYNEMIEHAKSLAPVESCGYLAGIECDGATYHSSLSARDNDIVRQKILESYGWNIYRIWSTNWFKDSNKELQKLLDYLNGIKSYKGNKTA